ncbi:MAG: hypothetical protein SVR08_10770 [Spirochaetota bacterium]|nr:hypothetical protein [Spirochaetota bacterium]
MRLIFRRKISRSNAVNKSIIIKRYQANRFILYTNSNAVSKTLSINKILLYNMISINDSNEIIKKIYWYLFD